MSDNVLAGWSVLTEWPRLRLGHSVRTDRQLVHYPIRSSGAGTDAWTSYQGFYGNEHLALAETRVFGFASSSQGTWACWSRREMSFLFGSVAFFFCDSILKICSCSFFSKLLSLSVGEGVECVCWLQKENFPTVCRTILHIFSSFLQSRGQSENFTLAESWRNGPFACKKTVKAKGKHPRRNFHLR